MTRPRFTVVSPTGEQAVADSVSTRTDGFRFRPDEITAPVRLPPATGTRSSVLAFSIWKAGSSLLYALLRELCPHAGLTYFGLDDELFEQDSFKRPLDVGSVFVDRGYCYGGFRCFPFYPVPILESARTIWLVRDPRDMLVSLYVERERAKTMSTDEWVGENYAAPLLSLEGCFAQGFTRRSNVAIYRYEDVIFRSNSSGGCTG